MDNFRNLIIRPVLQRLLWVAFAILFFYSGLFFTEWLLETQTFAGGGLRWALVGLFPVLVPLFFLVNRRFGCAGGTCRVPTAGVADSRHQARVSTPRMPGA